MDIEGGEKDRE